MSEEGTPSPIGGGGGGSETAEVSSTPEPTSSGSPAYTRETLIQSLPEDIRGETVFQNLNPENPIPDLANQFLNAQKMVGKNPIQAPDENWGDEQWGAFWDKAGRPETHDKYVMPEVEGLQWDDGKVSEVKEFAHKLGITDKQFGPLMERYGQEFSGLQEAQTQEMTATVEKQLTDLKAGLLKEGKDYDTVVELANEGLMGLEDESLVQLFSENPMLANHPAIVKMFSNLAEGKRESLAKTAGSAQLKNTLDAKSAIPAFEEKHSKLIYADPETLSWDDRTKREKVLKERSELYSLAYPDNAESS